MSIKIENIETYGWEAAVRGCRNPKNSWLRSDSTFEGGTPHLGENDIKLLSTLAHAGDDHGKFLRMITVTMDITAPLYWWKEADQYKVGTVTDSCSTMHKIHAKEFVREDFSWEHLYTPYEDEDLGSEELSCYILMALNRYRERYLQTNDKEDWWQMIQLLPSSYNQKRTIQLNYQVVKHMYYARRNHKLDEWHTLCAKFEKLPYFKELIGDGE